nr:putative glycosyltransferase [Anoectochilus roxburghii]
MRKPFPRRPSQSDADRNASFGLGMASTTRQPERKGRSRKGAQCRRSHWLLFGLALGVLMVLWMAYTQLDLMNALEGSGQRWVAGSGAPNWLRDFGVSVRFRPVDLLKRIEDGRRRLDQLRSEERLGVRPPRLAFVVGSMSKDSQTLLLLTLGKSLRELGYVLSIFALEDGEAHPLWEYIDCPVSILGSDNSILVDWTRFEGVVLSSLEGKRVISSLMEDPFISVPLIWLIQDGKLTKRLPSYIASGQEDLFTEWRSSFNRASTVVFSDFSLPMMYTSLDSGNFYVIPGSPADVWATKRFIRSHSRHILREKFGFHEEDLIITVIGSHFFYDDMLWSYAVSMLTPQMMKITRIKDFGGTFKFVFLCGNTTDSFGYDFEELASRMGFPAGSIKHYGTDGDVNGAIMIADIVLYGSFQEEQSFPPLLVRAMTFQIPIIVPDFAPITKYVNDKIHGFVFRPHDIDSLANVFLLLIKDKRLSMLAHSVSFKGRSLAENMQASDCINDFACLLESFIQFPSDSLLPKPVSQITQQTWAWDLFENKKDHNNGFQQYEGLWNFPATQRDSIIDILEKKLPGKLQLSLPAINGSATLDYPTQLDWDDLSQIEISEDFERREMEEIAERMERDLGSWEDVYRNAKKSEKLRFEVNERDEGELERTGQSLCIYEIYNGQGVWPFLHHGSLYRGISLSRGARRPRSDDVDAVNRLPVLNDSYYKDILCEFGAILSIANKVDSIHKIPWIGFQSWHASGRKVALSSKSEEVLENAIQDTSRGDAIYYWAVVDIDWKIVKENRNTDFWSLCDIINAGKCRSAFESAFRSIYGIPLQMPALPPMPPDGGQWSALHSWVLPTSSFLEFVMFSRIFVDSLDSLHQNLNNSTTSCFLGSSELERRHCYCRVLELLVNVWAYHSARRMFYLEPDSGNLQEQHPIELRRMWVKYFTPTLLKSIDEDLAEEADDLMHPTQGWLWPLTGEVHWQGILDREREDKYRKKMDKKRRIKEKLLDRHKHGYKQKSLSNL